MLLKKRNEPNELRILKALDQRMVLEGKEKQLFFNHLKGFAGETALDKWLEKLEIENLILNDLLLEINNSHFQIDSLVITQDTMYLFEVKNYEGDYYYSDSSFRTVAGNELKDPLLQLKRSETLLKQILRSNGYNLSLEAYLIFTHPEFTLLQAPLDQPIILPTQINRFFKNMNSKKSTLNSRHTKLADMLLSLNKTTSPYAQLPQYEYTQLEKGIKCADCHSTIDSHNRKSVICSNCGKDELNETAVLRSIEEFKLLFPERRVTVNGICEWCDFVVSKKIIRQILMSNYELVRNSSNSYYI